MSKDLNPDLNNQVNVATRWAIRLSLFVRKKAIANLDLVNVGCLREARKKRLNE